MAFLGASFCSYAQPKSFQLTTDGDTLNLVDNKGLKQGRWVQSFPELRGNPGYEEEGVYVNDKKNGVWRKFTVDGDLIAIENYKYGGKDGLQQYFTFVGNLLREENWRGFNPDSPYDTIPIYGTGSNDVLEFKIVKAEPYSVKHGTWKYYDDQGRLINVEEYDRNNLVVPKEEKQEVAERPKKIEKTAEMLEWERKNSGKKKALRDGATGL